MKITNQKQREKLNRRRKMKKKIPKPIRFMKSRLKFAFRVIKAMEDKEYGCD